MTRHQWRDSSCFERGSHTLAHHAAHRFAFPELRENFGNYGPFIACGQHRNLPDRLPLHACSFE
jgi:hypothetical protein